MKDLMEKEVRFLVLLPSTSESSSVFLIVKAGFWHAHNPEDICTEIKRGVLNPLQLQLVDEPDLSPRLFAATHSVKLKPSEPDPAPDSSRQTQDRIRQLTDELEAKARELGEARATIKDLQAQIQARERVISSKQKECDDWRRNAEEANQHLRQLDQVQQRAAEAQRRCADQVDQLKAQLRDCTGPAVREEPERTI